VFPVFRVATGLHFPRLTLIDTPEPSLIIEQPKKKAGTPWRGAGPFRLIHN
ncbi:uncharacterized protein METZ01_LOCUS145588, partial [marine metagenome]